MVALSEPTILIAFIAGVLTIATPCVIPILPPMLAGSVGHRLRPVFIVLGSSITFTIMGGAFAALGIAVGATKDALRFLFTAVIIALGATMVDEEIYDVYARYSSMFVNKLHSLLRKNTSDFYQRDKILPVPHPLASAFLLGLSLGIVWIPCVGPILGAVLAFAMIQGNLAMGSLLLLSYSIGLGIPMLLIAYGGKYTSAKVDWVKRNSMKIKKLAGWILILTGLAMLFGLDRFVQAKLLPYFPDIESKLLEVIK